MSRLVVLLSCMNSDSSIVQRSNIQTDVIVINQCDNNSKKKLSFKNKKGQECEVLFVNSKSRGLSRSRNIAITLATKWDYALLADDDEIFDDNYESTILDAYMECKADLITFVVKRTGKNYQVHKTKMKFSTILRTSSVQISFSLRKIIANDLQFDVKMGAGTGNGSGEEVQFIMQCKKKGLQLYYYPYQIATLIDGGDSTWFLGFNERYFQNRGWAARRTFGLLGGGLFILYNVFHNKRKFVNEGLSLTAILKNCFIGIISKR